jgi:hypothetical protein
MDKEGNRQNTVDGCYRNQVNSVHARLIYLNAALGILDAEKSELE